MKMLDVVKGADNMLQFFGELGIESADFTGGLVMKGIGVPAKIANSKKIRCTVGAAVIAGAYIYSFPKPPSGGVQYISFNLPPAAMTEVYKTDITEDRILAMAGQIAISTALFEEQKRKEEEAEARAKQITDGQLPAPGIVVSLMDVPAPEVDTTIINSPPVFSSSLAPTKALLDALELEKNPGPGLSQKEFNHLQKIVKYEGRTSIREAFLNMAPASQHKFYGLFSEYNRLTGELVVVKSAWRPVALQRKLKAAYGNRAAGACGSPHSMGAVDVDRNGEISRQVAKMTKLGLLNKYGLWVPPYVGESWHIEDPSAVYFRFWKRGDPSRGIYRRNVCAGLSGSEHNVKRNKDGVFTIVDSYRRILEVADKQLASRNITGVRADRIKEYLLLSVRSESMYGRQMISKTGAKGWWQFVDKVAGQYKLYYPMQLEEAMRATIDLFLDNEAFLVKNGVEPTVNNLYKAHVIGGTGFLWMNTSKNGGTLPAKSENRLRKIIAVQLPKAEFDSNYASKNGYPLKSGITIANVSRTFDDFFNDRLDHYRIDNAYVGLLAMS